MATTTEARMRLIREERYVTRLARQAVEGSGTRRAVARRWGRKETTISSYATRTMCPEFRDALRLLYQLATGSASDQTTARGFALAAQEAVQMAELDAADIETLKDRGVYLMDREPVLEAEENRSVLLSREAWRNALRAEAEAQIEMVDIDVVLEAKGGPDLRAEYRRRMT